MEALIVSFKDKTELKLVLDLLKKMKIEAKVLTEEEREDMGMTQLMRKVDRTQKVSRTQVMAKLGL